MSTTKKKPVCIIAIGMAGSGKSTFVQRINAHLHAKAPPTPPYVLNLDPAVANVPFEANIDIRDTVDYHEVMKQCAVAALPRRTTAQLRLSPKGTTWAQMAPSSPHSISSPQNSTRSSISSRNVQSLSSAPRPFLFRWQLD